MLWDDFELTGDPGNWEFYDHYVYDWQENVYRTAEFGKDKRAEWVRLEYLIIERDNHRCQACRKVYVGRGKLSAHHIIPRSEGGQDEFDNLITLCYRCHDYVEEQGFRSANRIRNCTRGIDWDELQRISVDAHNTFMDKLDSSRPDWHECVYGWNRRGKRRKQR